MSHLITLGVGCFGLGLVIAYALWASLRPSMLRAELQLIRAELDASMATKGAADDTSYIASRNIIHELVENVTYLSIPILFLYHFRRLSTSQEALATKMAFASPVAKVNQLFDIMRSDEAPDEVREAVTRVALRLFLHLTVTPSMVLLSIGLAISGRTEQLVKLISASLNKPQDLEKLVSSLR